jgi:DNA primase
VLLQALGREDLGPQGPALVQRIAQLHELEPGIDAAQELALVIDRLQLRALEDERKLLLESGPLSDQDAAHARELLQRWADLKKRLPTGA